MTDTIQMLRLEELTTDAGERIDARPWQVEFVAEIDRVLFLAVDLAAANLQATVEGLERVLRATGYSSVVFLPPGSRVLRARPVESDGVSRGPGWYEGHAQAMRNVAAALGWEDVTLEELQRLKEAPLRLRLAGNGMRNALVAKLGPREESREILDWDEAVDGCTKRDRRSS